MDEIKIDEVLEFCERVLCNVPLLWKECSLAQQQRLQQILFLQGTSYHQKMVIELGQPAYFSVR
jgi:hypothetical protein